MEKARCNTELYSNLREPLNNVKPSNFWGSHQLYLVKPAFSFTRLSDISAGGSGARTGGSR